MVGSVLSLACLDDVGVSNYSEKIGDNDFVRIPRGGFFFRVEWIHYFH